MKKIFSLLIAVIFSTTTYSQTDLGIEFANYTNGQTFSNDTIKAAFIITNHGNTMYHTGDTLYVNAQINGTLFSLDLFSSNATPIILKKMLHHGDTMHYDPGYLLGSATLPFYPGATTLEECLILWGKGIATVNNYGSDVNTANNTACVTFDPAFPTDLGIEFANYANGQTFSNDTIKAAFIITNHGNAMYHTGDTLYVNAQINGNLFSLDLFSANASPIVLTKMLHHGDTMHYDPGYLLGSATLLFYPGATTIEECLILWGKGMASVNNYGGDVNTANNTACVTFDPNYVSSTKHFLATDMELLVYPNPASEQVTFHLTSPSTISHFQVLSVDGKIIQELNNPEQQFFLDINNWNAGLYIYKILLHNGQFSFGKFSIKR